MCFKKFYILLRLSNNIYFLADNGRRKRRKKRLNEQAAAPAVKEEEKVEPVEQVEEVTVVSADKDEKVDKKKYDLKGQPVLMVEVENVTHEKFSQTEEVKVGFCWMKFCYDFMIYK